jgi:hypothetical protein
VNCVACWLSSCSELTTLTAEGIFRMFSTRLLRRHGDRVEGGRIRSGLVGRLGASAAGSVPAAQGRASTHQRQRTRDGDDQASNAGTCRT